MPDPNSPDGSRGIYVAPPADISGVWSKYLDLAYGKDSFSQKLDLYLPAGSPGRRGYPLIVFVHGGAWMMCDKRDIQLTPVLKALNRGYAVASINYRLSGEAIFPAQIHDVKAALRWLRANGRSYSLKTDKIAIWGGSAGAHLSALAGTSAGVEELEDLSSGNSGESSAVQAVVSWFGPTDFLKMDGYLEESGTGVPDHSDAASPESLLLGARITHVPDLVRKANPETWLTSDCPPFLLQHGNLDELVPHQMSEAFARLINETAGGGRAELTILDGARHGDRMFETDGNVADVLDFIGKYV